MEHTPKDIDRLVLVMGRFIGQGKSYGRFFFCGEGKQGKESASRSAICRAEGKRSVTGAAIVSQFDMKDKDFRRWMMSGVHCLAAA